MAWVHELANADSVGDGASRLVILLVGVLKLGLLW